MRIEAELKIIPEKRRNRRQLSSKVTGSEYISDRVSPVELMSRLTWSEVALVIHARKKT